MPKGRKAELIFLKYAFLIIIGLSSGAIISGGLFDFIVMIGVVTRLIGKTHTSNRVRLFETVTIIGGTLGSLVSVYNINLHMGMWFGILYGIFSGMFLGCLIMSLTETLDGIPILSRRLKLSVGLQYIISAFALGKLVGAFVYFFGGFY